MIACQPVCQCPGPGRERSISHLERGGTPSESRKILRNPPIIESDGSNARSLEQDAFSAYREDDNVEIYGSRSERDKASEQESGEWSHILARLAFPTTSARIFCYRDIGEHGGNNGMTRRV